MSMTSDVLRGHTDTIILTYLAKGDSYGYQISKMIVEKTNRQYELKEATLYAAFRRLENGKYIFSYWGDEESGARRRYYSITPEGRALLEENKKGWEEAKVIIDALIKEGQS